MSRVRILLGPILAGAALFTLLAGCGGSVADRDRPVAQAPEPMPPTPFCAAVQSSAQAQAPLEVLAGGGRLAPERLGPTLDEIRRSNTELLTTAPPEVRPDVQTYVRVIELQLDALVAADGDGAALSRDPALAAQVNTPENAAAGDRVSAFVTRTCAPRPDAG